MRGSSSCSDFFGAEADGFIASKHPQSQPGA
jgi:hypothetical protein